jgi:predicted DNA-binding transcriptional regulator AlpA
VFVHEAQRTNMEPRKKIDARTRGTALAGDVVIWPAGVRARYGISAPTLWRWEHSGRLPPRDFRVGDKTGWRRETLAAAEAADV